MTRSNLAVLQAMPFVLAAVVPASSARAQGLSGPLDTPTTTASTPTKPSKHAAVHRAKAANTARRAAIPASARLPLEKPAGPATQTNVAKSNAPVDPISFGLKWNGSNDSAGQTRIENLNGNATGTGAEVGMKLHF